MSLALDIDFNSTLGSLFVGFSLSCLIFGVLTMQAYTYFQMYPKDLLAYKTLVVSLWALELFDQAMIGHGTYTYVISHYDDVIGILTSKVIWSLIVQTVIGSFVGMIVKTCFALRVWRFSGRNVIVTGIILMLVVTTFALAVVYSVKSSALTALEIDNIRFYGTLALATGVSTDVLTASALCYFLRKLRTGHKTSDSLVNTLTIYAINTGALTSAISLTTLLLYNLRLRTLYFIASYFCLGKVYAISLLCTLNTRKMVRGRGTDASEDMSSKNEPASTVFLVNHHHQRQSHHAQDPQTKSMQIDVRREISVMTDVATSPTSDHEDSSCISTPEV